MLRCVPLQDGQGRTWGQFLCDQSREAGGVTDEAITAQIEGHSRLCTKEFFLWEHIYDTGRYLCCDQLGSFVDC